MLEYVFISECKYTYKLLKYIYGKKISLQILCLQADVNALFQIFFQKSILFPKQMENIFAGNITVLLFW